MFSKLKAKNFPNIKLITDKITKYIDLCTLIIELEDNERNVNYDNYANIENSLLKGI